MCVCVLYFSCIDAPDITQQGGKETGTDRQLTPPSSVLDAPYLPTPTYSQPCAAGDSAPYERRNVNLDDVVIVAALRTPLTKVRRKTPAQLNLHADSVCP